MAALENEVYLSTRYPSYKQRGRLLAPGGRGPQCCPPSSALSQYLRPCPWEVTARRLGQAPETRSPLQEGTVSRAVADGHFKVTSRSSLNKPARISQTRAGRWRQNKGLAGPGEPWSGGQRLGTAFGGWCFPLGQLSTPVTLPSLPFPAGQLSPSSWLCSHPRGTLLRSEVRILGCCCFFAF